MALNKEQLKQEFIQAFSDPDTKNNIEAVAQAMATAIHSYIAKGIVTGVCPPGGGALTQGKVR